MIERATRLAQFYTRSDKIYEGVVQFGWSTSSYDRAGEPTSETVEVQLTAEELEAALEPFRGEIRAASAGGVGQEGGRAGVPTSWRVRTLRWSWRRSRSRSTS